MENLLEEFYIETFDDEAFKKSHFEKVKSP